MRAEPAAVWAVDDGLKLEARDLDHPRKRGGLTFDAAARRVRLFAARNELVAFQVVVEGGRSETSGVAVRFDGAGDIRDGDTSDDPDRYFVGRRIEIFAERYVEVTERSHDLYWKPGSPAQPDVTGVLPDALVPVPTSGVTVPARRNQAFWIDIYVPKGTRPGRQRGSLAVTVGGKPCALPACTLDVELDVLDLELPDRPTTKTMVWFSGSDIDRDFMPVRYLPDVNNAPRARLDALRRRHYQLGRRHGITLFLSEQDTPRDELLAQLRGDWATPAAGYEGPGEGVEQSLCVLHTYGGARLPSAEAAEWASWFSANAPRTDAFFYVWDEPTPEELPTIRERALEARPMPSFVTTPYRADLPVDIFAATASSYSMRAARKAHAAGKRTFVYNGVRPYSGSFMIDDVAISPRVNPWIQYRYGIERWFFWEATYYRDNQGKRGPIDVLGRPDHFSNRDGDLGNGDGLLIYPGRDLLFPASDLGVDRPLPSFRLLNWRRGIQDVEYLALARSRGLDRFVDELLAGMIPAALADETDDARPVAWSEDGEDWLLARTLVAEALTTGAAPEIPARLRRKPPTASNRARAVWLAVAAVGALAGLAIAIRARRNARAG